MRKLYTSPEMEYQFIDIVEDVLSISNPDIAKDKDILDDSILGEDPIPKDEGDIDDLFG